MNIIYVGGEPVKLFQWSIESNVPTHSAVFHQLQTGAEVCQTNVTVHIQQDIIRFDIPTKWKLFLKYILTVSIHQKKLLQAITKFEYCHQ